MNFIHLIDYAGTFAFAISGIRLASAKRFDWFGAYVVGLVTAIGGGTIRDLLLNVTPFWMLQPSYLIVTALALVSVILMGKYLIRLNNTFFIFDAIGLGLFVVVGIEKSLAAHFPFWVAILMGMITGSAGGVIRDILINEVPLIFRKDIYALACVVGGLVFLACAKLHVSSPITQTASAMSIILTRVLAVKYHISLPVLKGHEENN
ncbi:MAG TPA: trimeric intracellular cation channel family protein [Paludibacter sp.]|nr:trimeric intracellular cation channel family protein [Paludibacter sp.]